MHILFGMYAHLCVSAYVLYGARKMHRIETHLFCSYLQHAQHRDHMNIKEAHTAHTYIQYM